MSAGLSAGSEGKRTARVVLLRVLRWVGAAILLVVFIVSVDWQGAGKALRGLHIGSVLAYAALIAATTLVGVVKYRLIMGRSHRLVEVGYLYFLSKTAGSLTPGRIGDFAPLVDRRYRDGRVLTAILTDKVLEFYTLMGSGLLGFSLVKTLGTTPYLFVVAMFLGATALLVILIAQSARRSYRYDRICARHWLGQRLRSMTLSIGKSIVAVRRKIPLLMVLTIAAFLLGAHGARILLGSTGIVCSMPIVFQATFISGVLQALPILPAGLGIAELSMVVFFRQLGADTVSVAAYMAITRIVNLGVLFALYGTFATLHRLMPPQPDSIDGGGSI